MRTKIYISMAVMLIATACIGPSQRIPFVGTKRFNFVGGEGTEQTITIKADRSTLVQFASSTNGKKPLVLYRGKYVNPIPVGDGMSYLIKGGKIYIVSKGEVEKDCKKLNESGKDESDLCVSDLK